jgi:hypothetical protein
LSEVITTKKYLNTRLSVGGSTVVEHSPCNPKVEGSSLATYAAADTRKEKMPFIQPTCRNNVNPIKLGLNIKGKIEIAYLAFHPVNLPKY